LALLVAGLTTFALWVVVISSSVDSLYISSAKSGVDLSQPNEILSSTINKLSTLSGTWALAALVLTALLALFPRVRKYEKRLVVDGLTIASFLLLATAFCQTTVRYFINTYL